MPGAKAPPRSSCMNVGAREGAAPTSPWYCTMPIGTPTAAPARMPQQERPGNPSRHQHGGDCQRHQRQQRLRCVEAPQRHQRAGRIDDNPGPLQPDHRHQQADPGRNRMLDRTGNRDDEPLSQADSCRDDEQSAGESDGAERSLPGDLHAHHDGIREEEVVTHRRRHGDRIVCEEGHQRRRKSGGEAGCGEHGALVHAGRAEHGGLHEDDVGHRQEGGEAGQHFGPDGRAVRGEREATLENAHGQEFYMPRSPGLEATPPSAWRAACAAARRGSRAHR